MTIAEALVNSIQELPPTQQQEVLDFAEFLKQQHRKHAGPLISPEGICREIPFDVSFEQFQGARREMWRDATDRELS